MPGSHSGEEGIAILFVHARDESFFLQFIHHAGVDELAPIALFLDLHEFEKYRRVFRTGCRYARKDFQPEIISVLQNLRIVLAQVLAENAAAEFAIRAEARQPS